MSTGTRYELRSDHPNPASASEWAIFAIDANSHRRHVALTTVKAEAEAMLLGLQHGVSMLAALEANLRDVRTVALNIQSGTVSPDSMAEWLQRMETDIRAAIAKAKGGAQ